MEGDCIILLYVISTCFLSLSAKTLNPSPSSIGIAPQDEKLFASQMIMCKDKSKFFPRDRLNDGFCDCPDGTDEPGTSACPESRFYCKNVGSTPRLLFSSRVNDHVCDCCDGSDEYEGSIHCPNTCFGDMKVEEYQLRGADLNNLSKPKNKHGVNLDDLLQKFKELKLIIMVEVVIVSSVISFLLSRRRARSRKRRFR